ncbi:hypothetical protein OFN93_01360 [Campylobacter sp. CN_NE4]|nr:MULTISPECIES: hypothetical protein [unclassified Campylobacter]MDA3064930.1 hypothetical protein [Campylobacter sp. CN_NE4]MDA3068246.1 hypothetical protein [Campylobacter sp. CN_NE3]MDA3084076.1 hypothetical protein [Campylobacter sp. CN_NE1]WBR52292.1 hypothetical protein PF028_05030 [Campylobacter sp. CN_NE2]
MWFGFVCRCDEFALSLRSYATIMVGKDASFTNCSIQNLISFRYSAVC